MGNTTSAYDGSILDRLLTECPFPRVFYDMEKRPGEVMPVPRMKIGHIRADHDGCRWWATSWPCHPKLTTLEMCAEIDRVYEALTAENALADLNVLIEFCRRHPEACADQEYRQEYEFFLVGEACDFWIRLLTRPRDYNLYLNAFVKEP